MQKFFSDLLTSLVGSPDATKIGRTLRAFVLAIAAALLFGLVDVIRQWFVVFSTGAGVIDWHIVQIVILDAVVPLFLVWLGSLARYFQSEANQLYTPQSNPDDTRPHTPPRNFS